MKTKKLVAALILITGGLFLFSSCDEETVTEYVEKINGCTNSSAINYNPSATDDDGTCILPDQLDDTTRTFYSAAAYAADNTKKPRIDKAHCNVMWETSYRDLGFSLLTGRFAQFDGEITFNEKDPSKTNFSGWVQITSNLTGEDGRDNWETNGCMPTSLGVEYTAFHMEWNGTDSVRVNDAIDASTDTAYLQVDNVEFYYTTKRGFTTSYKGAGTLTFKGVTSDVDVFFNYNGLDYTAGRTGWEGYFDMKAKSVFGVSSSNIADDVRISFNIQARDL